MPWPAHLEPPHAGTEAHPHVKRPDIAIEMIVISDEVAAAMARALEHAGIRTV